MSYGEFLSFSQEGNVGIVRLSRPEAYNTMSAPFFEAMIELQEEKIIGNHELRSIALLADGKHFSAGIDLNYASTVIGKPGRSLYGVKYWQRAYQFWARLQSARRGRNTGRVHGHGYRACGGLRLQDRGGKCEVCSA